MDEIFEINEEQEERSIDEIIDGLTLFDDDLMSKVFDKNIPATELLLGIVLDRKIKVTSVIGQDEMKSPIVGGRTITLDIHAIDENKHEIDVEVQGNASGAHVRRARYHSGVVDSRMLEEGQDFKELKDSYVIFMYKHDKFKKGLPIYHIDRYVRETNELFEDGSHIIYVNGKYKGDDPLGQLISDFHQTKAEKIHYKELADGVRHFKETEGGREDMCEAMEKYAKSYGDKRELKANLNSVKKLMSELKMTLEQALDFLGLDSNQRAMVTKQLQK